VISPVNSGERLTSSCGRPASASENQTLIGQTDIDDVAKIPDGCDGVILTVRARHDGVDLARVDP